MPDETRLKVGDSVTLQGTIRGAASGDYFDVEIGDPNDKAAAPRSSFRLHKSHLQPQQSIGEGEAVPTSATDSAAIGSSHKPTPK